MALILQADTVVRVVMVFLPQLVVHPLPTAAAAVDTLRQILHRRLPEELAAVVLVVKVHQP
jgi:hypothetical protein